MNPNIRLINVNDTLDDLTISLNHINQKLPYLKEYPRSLKTVKFKKFGKAFLLMLKVLEEILKQVIRHELHHNERDKFDRTFRAIQMSFIIYREALNIHKQDE